ncbi:MAG: radical SAM protein [Candidatus Sumerlaeota bacterium]|nr:radical SAM protein [Candidatus Sumerlaeota bacterium]
MSEKFSQQQRDTILRSHPTALSALFVNPWITDVAAYDLWARPLGLLYLAGLLRRRGWRVGLVDCMDRRHPSLIEEGQAGSASAGKIPGGARHGVYYGRDDGCGRGKYRAQTMETPDCLLSLRRRFRRYGISLEAFERDAAGFGRPDLILVTTRMTYWYPGAQLAIERLRRLFPGVPVALGGVYATLCPDHARRHSGADYVIEGEGENQLLALAESLAPGRFDSTPVDLERLDDLPEPAWDLAYLREAPAVLTSRGCPMHCSYCASRMIYVSHRRRDPGRVAEEILRLVCDHGAGDAAFYDDALLVDWRNGLAPLLDALIAAGAPVRLHTPNGIHASMVNEELASKMRAARFETLRLSLETANAAHLNRLNRPVNADHFLAAMRALRAAGFGRRQLGVYLLAGLPGQGEQEVRDSIDLAIEAGGWPLVGEYSPLPGTPAWEQAVRESGLPLEEEPLLQNNSVFHRLAPWSRDGMIERLQRYAREQIGKHGVASALH